MRSVSKTGDTLASIKGGKQCQSSHSGHGGITDTAHVLSTLTTISLVTCV